MTKLESAALHVRVLARKNGYWTLDNCWDALTEVGAYASRRNAAAVAVKVTRELIANGEYALSEMS